VKSNLKNRGGESEIAHNLAKLVSELDSHKELTCVEELIVLMSRNNKIPDKIVPALWDNFEKQIKILKTEENFEDGQKFQISNRIDISLNSLFIVSIIAQTKPQIVSEQFGQICDFFIENLKNFAFFTNSMLSYSTTMYKYFFEIAERCNKIKKLEQTQLEKIENLAIWLILDEKAIDERKWFSVAQKAVNAIFSLSESPSDSITKTLKQFAEEKNFKQPNDLAKFLFLVGAVAMAVLVLMEKQENSLKALKARKDKIDNLIATEKGENAKSS
ncbi:condensin complex non-SMC subunit Cnd1, partial [Bonamia ostreae]